jgi:acetyl-CoA acetyltransferase
VSDYFLPQASPTVTIVKFCCRYSQFQDEYTLDQILKSPKVSGPLTKLQCCPTSDGAAAAILATEDFVLRHNLQQNAVEILGMEMATDLPSSFNDKSCIKVVSSCDRRIVRFGNGAHSHTFNLRRLDTI